jgi:hypothetical protein
LVEDANMIHPIKTAFAAVALATTFGASAAMAGTIVIDDFNTPGTVISELGGNPDMLSVSGPVTSILGGNRFMQTFTNNGSDLGTGLTVTIGTGQVSFANDPTSTGTGWLVYDGTFDRAGLATPATVAGLAFDASVNPTGLATAGVGIDFLQGQLDGFFTFSAANFDNLDPGTLTFSAFAWDMGGNEVSYFEEINPATFTPNLFFSQFSVDGMDPTAGLGGFNWGNVGALAFRIDSTQQAFDGQLGAITATPIPLPASVLLLLGGVGGLAGLSAAAKRRRKA